MAQCNRHYTIHFSINYLYVSHISVGRNIQHLISGNKGCYLFYGRAILIPFFIPPMYGLLLFLGVIMPLKIKEAIIRKLKRVFSKQLEDSLPQRLREYTPLINH